MPCFRIQDGIVSYQKSYRLCLEDETCVFMDWHWWCGPIFYRDKTSTRMIDDWYENKLIVNALDWFIGRRKIA